MNLIGNKTMNTNIIIFYFTCGISFFLFSFLLFLICCTLMGKSQQGNKKLILYRGKTIRITITMCIIQCLASIMTVLDQSLYAIWIFSWGTWIGHTVIVSSITYILNLIGKALLFSMFIILLKFISTILEPPKGQENNYANLVDTLCIVFSALYGIISMGMFIFVLYYPIPYIPSPISPSIRPALIVIGNGLSSLGWILLFILMTPVYIFSIICFVSLYRDLAKYGIDAIQKGSKRILLIFILLQISALMSSLSDIGYIISMIYPFFLHISYILDKLGAFIFSLLYMMLYIHVDALIVSIENPSETTPYQKV